MIKEKKLLQIEKYSYKVLKLDFCRYEKQVLITDTNLKTWIKEGCHGCLLVQQSLLN